MKIITDLHIHSRFSRACSPKINVENLDLWAKIKGINVLGTGDFTHPEWLKELKTNLEPAETGLFCFKKSTTGVRFLLTSEISCIYSKGGKVRKVHIVVFAPSFEAVDEINSELDKIGNLKSDGRPILGLDVKELARIVLTADKDCLIVPAHIWTPWFALFGSKSGFNSIEECFEDYAKHIYAVETGLSSSPSMNWQLSSLDNIALISNSDAHSASKIGREANVFDTELSYHGIIDAIKSNDPKKFLYTIEFFPEEGKYHYDGHRSCDICFDPQQSLRSGGICPVCGKALTIGVLSRVQELADRPLGSKGKIPFKSIIPLEEIISECVGIGPKSKKVQSLYDNMIKGLKNEFYILIEASRKEIEEVCDANIAEGIIRVREGKVNIKPGHDGVFGRIEIFSETDLKKRISQSMLF
ncbi:MAG: endonuclease Q family protein [Patescibacteria group bacterium]